MVCGVTDNWLPATQYAYVVFPTSPAIVTVSPETVVLPLVPGTIETTPSPPVWWTVAEQVQPPFAADAQSTEA